MALANGPNTGLLVDGDIGELHYLELMRKWRAEDLLLQCVVISRLSTPPGSPSDGDSYIVAASPTGAWVGHATHLARWSAKIAAWEFIVPKEGWDAHVIAETTRLSFLSGTWSKLSGVIGSAGRISVSAGANPVVDLVSTGITPGTYQSPTLTVDAYGRITTIVASAVFAVGFYSPGVEVWDVLPFPDFAVPWTMVNYV